jgi:hypothetical protein
MSILDKPPTLESTLDELPLLSKTYGGSSNSWSSARHKSSEAARGEVGGTGGGLLGWVYGSGDPGGNSPSPNSILMLDAEMRGGSIGSIKELDRERFLSVLNRRLKERDCFSGGRRVWTRRGVGGEDGVRGRECGARDDADARCVEMRSPSNVGAGLLLRGFQGNGVWAERGPSSTWGGGILMSLRGRELDLWRDTETFTSTSTFGRGWNFRVLTGWFSSVLEGKRNREDVESVLWADGGRAVAVDVEVRDEIVRNDAGVFRPSTGLFGTFEGRSTSADARVRSVFKTLLATPGRVDGSSWVDEEEGRMR